MPWQPFCPAHVILRLITNHFYPLCYRLSRSFRLLEYLVLAIYSSYVALAPACTVSEPKVLEGLESAPPFSLSPMVSLFSACASLTFCRSACCKFQGPDDHFEGEYMTSTYGQIFRVSALVGAPLGEHLFPWDHH